MKFFSAMVLVSVALFVGWTHGADGPTVALLRVPNGGIQPQVLTDSRGGICLIYFAGDPAHGDVFFVRSDDDGRTFSKPLRVNSQPGSAVALGTIRGPRLAIGRGDRVHVAWNGSDRALPKANEKSAPMLYARMNDAGDGFEAQRNVITRHPGLDGGGAIAADAEGNVYIAWHAPGSRAEEADRRVWLTRSHDDGQTFDAESEATGEKTGACGCCGLNIAASRQGKVFILFRTATDMVRRDTHLLASTDRGRTFQLLNADPWRIGMCSMSTAAFSPSTDGMLAAWETKEQIRFTRIQPGQAIPGDIVSVPGGAGSRKHPAAAVNRRGAFVIAWAEGTGWNKGGAVGWRVFDPAGQPVSGQAGRVDGLPVWGAPAAFVARDGTFRVIY